MPLIVFLFDVKAEVPPVSESWVRFELSLGYSSIFGNFTSGKGGTGGVHFHYKHLHLKEYNNNFILDRGIKATLETRVGQMA